MSADDLPSRVRSLEDSRASQGERLARVESVTEVLSPLVGDLAKARSVADEALREVADLRDDMEAERRDKTSRSQWKITAIAGIIGTLIALLTLLFFILQFAGVGHG